MAADLLPSMSEKNYSALRLVDSSVINVSREEAYEMSRYENEYVVVTPDGDYLIDGIVCEVWRS